MWAAGALISVVSLLVGAHPVGEHVSVLISQRSQSNGTASEISIVSVPLFTKGIEIIHDAPNNDGQRTSLKTSNFVSGDRCCLILETLHLGANWLVRHLRVVSGNRHVIRNRPEYFSKVSVYLGFVSRRLSCVSEFERYSDAIIVENKIARFEKYVSPQFLDGRLLGMSENFVALCTSFALDLVFLGCKSVFWRR